MPVPLPASYVVPNDLTEEQIADAQRALRELVVLLAEATAEACDELGIDFDLDDPRVARDIMAAAIAGVFHSAGGPKRAG